MPSGSGQTRANGKVKVEKVASKRSRRSRVDEGDDEEESGNEESSQGRRVTQQPQNEEESGEEEQEEEEEEGAPRGGKRRRVNEEGDSRSSPGPSDDQEDEDGPRQPKPKMKTLPRDTDGFIPGSIMRIQLHNFVTYDFVEFRPGPYLNMIVGPNGTGKSSIACAIALGLNFHPRILGRASELNAFVKNGTETGYIEIELKGPAGKGNLVIRRSLSSKDKKSSFTLNGQQATGKEVTTKMAELNVQVENLCSFLPQDKVSSFAAMTPQQLLVETQKAAGDPNLTSWYETLKDEGKQLKVALQKLKDDEESVKQMKDRNDNIEREVQRFLERKKIEQEIAILEVLLPVAQYRELRIKFMQARDRQRKAHKERMRLKETNAPAHDLEKKLDAAAKKASERRDFQKKSMQSKAGMLNKKQSESDKLDSKAEDLINRLSNLKRNEKERVRSIKVKEAELEKTREELDRAPPKLEDASALKDQQKQLNQERRDLLEENEQVQANMRSAIEKKLEARGIFERLDTELQRLDTTDSKKLALLQKWDNDTADAVKWLRNNKDKFKMDIIEPPIISVSVTNSNYAAYAEAGFSGVQMRMVVAQCEEDLSTLNHYINDTTKALGRKVRVPTYWRRQQPHSILPPSLTPEEMKELQFDGYILEYLQYPPGLEYFLKKELNLHRIAVSRKANIDVNKTMQVMGRGGGGVFINGTTYNVVNRSRYGKRTLGNMSRELGPARNFVVPPIDLSEKHRLENKKREAQADMDLNEEEKQLLQAQLVKIAATDKELRARADVIKERNDAIRKEGERLQRLKAKLRKLETDLETLRDAPSVEEERSTAKKELMGISKKRIKIAREYTSLAESIYQEQVECTKAGLEYVQAMTNHAALRALCAVKDEKYQKAVEKFNELDKIYKELKKDSFAMLELSRERIPQLEEELQERVREIESMRTKYDSEVTSAQAEGRPAPDPSGVELRSSEELAIELENQRANLEITINTNPGVIEEYEKRKRDINQLERTIEATNDKVRRHSKKIKMHRDQWFPALQKLVESIGDRFSAAFDRVGCAGEIRIKEDEDYEQWAIEIYVKFRDTEKLQLLTGQRQSGGERSFTTILYLMSLTEEARAPFSLVDEINQGMDQRAERTVHNSMVDVTCKEDSAQYFLITPKLLTDLNYHERMKVLCVNNGEWLPEDKGLGNMMNMIEGYVSRNKDNRGRASA